MNSLIVIAHPKEKSFSFAMAEKYKNLAKEQGYTEPNPWDDLN